MSKKLAKYPHYLPSWNPSARCPISEPFEHHEVGRDAPASRSLADLSSGAKVSPITPRTGSEITGLQLSSLDDAGKNEVARLAAERKVLAFRDQDFADLPIPDILEFCKYFGRPSVHPVGPTPYDYPEIHIAHKSSDDSRLDQTWSKHTTSLNWHVDGSVDTQPPGLVFLYMLECPECGGDTVFTNTAEAYEKLSPAFRERLHGLQAEHADVDLIETTKKAGRVVRRDGAKAVHPLVRTHVLTHEKSLFVNPIYTTQIIGYKAEESDNLLQFLYNHIALAQDCQVRLRWSERTVVVFDNRAVCHSALFDYLDNSRRHVARVALSAEKPFETPFEEDH